MSGLQAFSNLDSSFYSFRESFHFHQKQYQWYQPRHLRSGPRKLFEIRSESPLAKYRNDRRVSPNNAEVSERSRVRSRCFARTSPFREFALVAALQHSEGVIARSVERKYLEKSSPNWRRWDEL
jgi:hypothetical protein